MGIDTKIQWTDHTFNPWWGCTKISSGCAHCYADSTARRWGLKIWGDDAPRRFFGDAHWNEPLKWNKDAAAAKVRRRVFCASMADVMEDREDLTPQRERLFALIEKTPHLDWQLLTKRPELYLRYLPESWIKSPRSNVWLGTSCEDQANASKRIPHLLRCPAAVRFLSCEPLLGSVNLKPYLANDHTTRCPGSPAASLPTIDWVIVGGESGTQARPCNVEWIRSIVQQCTAAGVAVFVKQLGSRPVEYAEIAGANSIILLNHPKGGDPAEWPADLRVRQMPEVK